MPENIDIASESGIAEIVARDEVTIEEMRESQARIALSHKARPITGLLYDGRHITRAPKEEDLYFFSKQMAKSGRFKGIPFALLTSRKSALPYMFLALTANRHGQTVRVFAERQAALDWLRESKSPNTVTPDTPRKKKRPGGAEPTPPTSRGSSSGQDKTRANTRSELPGWDAGNPT
jgi:hypothetical protein